MNIGVLDVLDIWTSVGTESSKIMTVNGSLKMIVNLGFIFEAKVT